MWWIRVVKEGQTRSETLVNWDGFFIRNIKLSRYGFLLQWKRSNKLSRGHNLLLYNGSHHIASANLPDACDFGCKWDDAHKVYQPILTTNLSAVESITELSSCKFKTGCNSGRCRCHQNSLVCSEVCLSQNCQNSVEEYTMPHQDEDYEQ